MKMILLLVALFVSSSGVAAGWGTGGGANGAARAFEGAPAPILAEVSAGEAAGLAALSGLAALAAQHFMLRRYIRDAAGVRETQDVRVANDPLVMQTPTRFATHEELNRVIADVDSLRKEMKADLGASRERMEERFDQLNTERRTSIAGLHAKLDAHETADARRTEVIMEKIGELRGATSNGGRPR